VVSEDDIKMWCAEEKTFYQQKHAPTSTGRVSIDQKGKAFALCVGDSSRADAGEYTITAENNSGSVTVTVKVLVMGKPGPPWVCRYRRRPPRLAPSPGNHRRTTEERASPITSSRRWTSRPRTER
ncbi:Titin-like, partial [Branchiostoma belcheri]